MMRRPAFDTVERRSDPPGTVGGVDVMDPGYVVPLTVASVDDDPRPLGRKPARPAPAGSHQQWHAG